MFFLQIPASLCLCMKKRGQQCPCIFSVCVCVSAAVVSTQMESGLKCGIIAAFVDKSRVFGFLFFLIYKCIEEEEQTLGSIVKFAQPSAVASETVHKNEGQICKVPPGKKGWVCFLCMLYQKCLFAHILWVCVGVCCRTRLRRPLLLETSTARSLHTTTLKTRMEMGRILCTRSAR